MSKRLLNISFLFIIIIYVFSCKRPPEWPNEPVISQEENTVFKNTGGTDTIIFTIAFQDGDGNLGLEEFDTVSPWHSYDLVTDSAGNPIFLTDINDLNIYRYEIGDVNDDDITDTFRVKRNIYKDNIWFDFVRVNELDEIIDTLDFETYTSVGVRNFNSRFEPLYKKSYTNEIYEGPINGTLIYKMKSSGFPKGRWKFAINIVDRDLNVSNTLLTSPAVVIE